MERQQKKQAKDVATLRTNKAMYGHTNIVLVYACLVLVSVHPLVAQKKNFEFSADRTSANLAEGSEETILEGNAKVNADDILIETEKIALYGDEFQFAEIPSRFIATDLKNDFSIEGDSLFFDREKKLLRAQGNVLFIDTSNDLSIRAGFIESRNDGEFLIIQLGVRIVKSDELSARCDFLTYYRESELLEMGGAPYALWNDDEYQAEQIILNLQTDEVKLKGSVTGSISTESEPETASTESEQENIISQGEQE